MKQADSVLKGFATSVAVVLTISLSVVFFNDRVNELFLVGATLVILAVRTYTKNPPVDVPSEGTAAVDLQAASHKQRERAGQISRRLLSLIGFVILTLPKFNNSSLQDIAATGTPNSCFVKEVLPLVPARFRNVSVKLQEKPLSGYRAEYMRSEEEWLAKQQHTNTTTCSSSLKVYALLMDKVNCFGGEHTFMVAYGELIHLLRDKAMLHPNGNYIDDDFDTWVTAPTLQMILNLEPNLWSLFGWSIRVFYSRDKSATFAQIIPVCGHKYVHKIGKVKDGQYPTIELYVMKEVWCNDKGWMLKDIWQGNSFPRSWILPARPYPFEVITPESTTILNLQLPAQPEKVLDCLYGNWHVFSSKHARVSLECKDNM